MNDQILDDIARLRAVLPPITHRGTDIIQVIRAIVLDEQVALDCEWVGPDLTTVGIGNEHFVLQFDWAGECEWTRASFVAAVEALVRRVPVVYHAADADIKVLLAHGFDVHPDVHYHLDDTMLAHAVLHSEAEHSLEFLCETYGKLPPHKHLQEVAPDIYNAADVVQTFLVWNYGLRPELEADSRAMFIYRTQQIPFMAAIKLESDAAGVRVNKGVVYPLRDKFTEKIEQATALAQMYAGWPLSLSSPQQMAHYLYTVEGMPEQCLKSNLAGGSHDSAGWRVLRAQGQSTRAGAALLTTNKDAIAALRRHFGTEWDADEAPTLEQAWANIEAGGHPVLEARYLFMGAQQSLSHYVAPCCVLDKAGEIVGIRDRIYPECRQHVQASGRHSYVNPALQQYKGELFNLLTPDPGTVWVGHDWSNIETWLLGALAGDEVILAAKEQGWDTHVVNFCDISGTPRPPIMTKALHTAAECAAWRAAIKWQGEDDLRRTFSKRFVYRLHYRGKAENAGDIPGARSLGFVGRRLVEASERYLAKHPAIVEFWRGIERQVDQHGVVYTFMGRPRRLTSQYQGARYREGSNHPMQGGVADIYVTTALQVKQAAPWARFVFGAHDSQWWQVPADREAEFVALYAPIVTRPFRINGLDISFPGSFKRRVAA